MKKLVLIGQIDPFESKISGTRNYVMNFLNSLNSKEQVLLCGYTTSKNEDQHLNENIEFLPLIVYKDDKKRSIFPQSFRLLCRLYKYRKRILEKGDVLHIQRFDYAIPFLYLTKKAKIIVYFHGAASKGYLTGSGIKSKSKGYIYSILERIILPKVDRIVTVSKKDEEFYANKFPKIKEKIKTIPIPVDLNEFHITLDKRTLRNNYGLNENHKIITYIGRFSKIKGIDLIIKAFVDLNKTMPETELVLVGDGEEGGALKDLAKDLNAKNIHFLGNLPHKDIPDILNCADVLVMASYTEGMPTVILEALACGLPVVSTDVGDIGNIINNEKLGFLVKERNEAEFKNNLIEAIKISDKYKEERQNVARSYSAPTIAKKIVELHNEVAE
jgi:glycosyltransferase involved in cell wall biosynthesis